MNDLVDQALLALKKGDFSVARAHIRGYATTHPREELHYKIEGLAALAMADWAAAHEVFSAAGEAYPDNAQFWFNCGLAEENLGKLNDAESSYQRSLKLNPDQGEIFGNLSNIYRRLGRFPEAVKMACRAVASNVPKAHALNVLGLALGKQGNFAEAQKAFDEALSLSPKDGAFLANRANLAVDQLKFEEAWKFFSAARDADDSPIIRRDEGMARLLAGDYATGLPLYEARLELPNALRLRPPCPRWQGENLSGKTLLLISEQGFGDTIQFSRYYDRLIHSGANLVWLVRQPLVRFLSQNLPGIVVSEEEISGSNKGEVPSPLAGRVREGLANICTDLTIPPLIPPASGGDAMLPPVHDLPKADFWLPILSLPLALGMAAAIPPTSPLFRAAAEPKLPATHKKRKIGLVWMGSRTHERDHERSIPLERFTPLWEKIDAQFYAPFKGTVPLPLRPGFAKATPGLGDCVRRSSQSVAGEGLGEGCKELLRTPHLASPARGEESLPFNRQGDSCFPIIALDHLITDFADAAAFIAQLDCLITVDTASAHLAGALGVPTYLLLQYCSDWRWGASGETTPWYKSVTLLRQPSYGDWGSVIARLLERL